MAGGLHLTILRHIGVFASDGTKVALKRQQSVLLARLLLEGKELAPSGLMVHLRDKSAPGALHTAMSKLRSSLKPYGVELPHQDRYRHTYAPPIGPLTFDAFQFTEAVRALAEPPEPATVDGLLEMWQCDPFELYPDLRGEHWTALEKAHVTLVRQADALLRGGADLHGWESFAASFPEHDLVRQVRQPSVRTMLRRPRLLIVEDRLGPYLGKRLGDYDCEYLESFEDWRVMVDSGHVDFDGALVDRNLKRCNEDEDGTDDGYRVLADLRRLGIPRLLMTAFPPEGDNKRLIDRYGLYTIYVKNRDAEAPDIRDVVEDMLKDASG